MDLNLRLIQAKDFLIASPTGEFDLENAKRMLVELACENATPGQYDVLIDIRDTSEGLSLPHITELVQMMIDCRDSFRSKLAILTTPGRRFDKAKFLEQYAGNSGFQVGAFVDFEEALLWLMAPARISNASFPQRRP
jgi:hypothetical protein